MTILTRRRILPAPAARAWSALAEPAQLAEWFADADRWEPGERFRLDFGDGDFFAGRLIEFREPRGLLLRWRFLGIGPESEVRIELGPEGASTVLEIEHRGSFGDTEAGMLSDGWDDFLDRLDLYLRTGERARYEWTEEIVAVASIPGVGPTIPAALADPAWWRSSFPGANISRSGSQGGAILATFRARSWGEVATHATIEAGSSQGRCRLEVRHEGWAQLPRGSRLPERARYAGLWSEALAGLEWAGRDGGDCEEANPAGSPGMVRGIQT